MGYFDPNPLSDRINMGPPLRAEGNLGYLEFIDLVDHMWKDSHPEIPIVPTQGTQEAEYPAIVYGLELKKTHSAEPKPRFREEIVQDGDENFLIHGWRFQIVVTFKVIDRNPRLAEEILDVFEDFMLEYQPVFKRLGVSELMYARRLPDEEITRTGEDLNVRAVSYMLTTEKVMQTSVTKLQEVLVDARIFLENNRIDPEPATPDSITTHIHDQFSSATPNQ